MRALFAMTLLATSWCLGVMQEPCTESQACWDPETMGNHQGHLPSGQVPIPGDHTEVAQ